MPLRKIAFTLLITFMYNFAVAQALYAHVVEDINQRILVSRVDFNQYVNDSGKIVMYICADNAGDVTQVQVLRSKSTIKDLSTLSAVANEALNMKFEAVRSALPQCGEMTFDFDEKPSGRKDIISTSRLGQDKVIGSRPTPPSTVETGDLGKRNILRHPNLNEVVEQDGLIVLYLCADKYGRVMKAQAVRSQSTIKDPGILLAAARAAKIQMKFSPGKGTDCMYYKMQIEEN